MGKITVSSKLFKKYSKWILENKLEDHQAECWSENSNYPPTFRGMEAIKSRGSRYHQVGRTLLTSFLVSTGTKVQNGYTFSSNYGRHMCLQEVLDG